MSCVFIILIYALLRNFRKILIVSVLIIIFKICVLCDLIKTITGIH
jgi:hypothetical protein